MECFVANRPVSPADITVDFERRAAGPSVIIRGHLSAPELLAASEGLLDGPMEGLTQALQRLRTCAAEPLLAALFPQRGGRPRFVLRSLDELRGLDCRIVFTAHAHALR